MEKRRLKRVSLSPFALVDLLRPSGRHFTFVYDGLPATATLYRVGHDLYEDSLVLIFEDDSFEEIDMGMQIPRVDVACRRFYLEDLRTQIQSARDVIGVIARPACAYPDASGACNRCSTCLARAWLKENPDGV